MISNEEKYADVNLSTMSTESLSIKPVTEDPLPDVTMNSEHCSIGNAEIAEEESVSKEDCDALYKECLRVQLENVMCAEKIRRVNKVISRIQKERKFLMKKLEEFGDDYHAEKAKLVDEEERRIAAILQEDQELTAREFKKPKKKMKVKRLQNAPKKPTNAFLMFCQKNRDLVQERYNKTEISRQEMTKKLAEIWQKTSQEDRKMYYEMYEKDKARYAREMKVFESKNSAAQVPNETPSSSTGMPTNPKDLEDPSSSLG